MAGIRGEMQKNRGPKLATLKTMVDKETDFLIITETKTAPSQAKNKRLKYNLVSSLYTTEIRPKSGIIIYAKKEHKIITESIRESAPKGHTITAVYIVKGKPCIIAGVYGVPDNNDRKKKK